MEETYAYTAVLHIAAEEFYPVNMGGINEFQLSAGASTGGSVKPEVEKLTPWPDTVAGRHPDDAGAGALPYGARGHPLPGRHDREIRRPRR